MPNKFFEGLTTKNLITENGMPTHSSSGSFVVDFFYEMGGYRKNASKGLDQLVSLFFAAYGENPNLAVKALFNLRDPRGGMGERNSARVLWHFFAKAHPEVVRNLIRFIPEYGRWDDMLAFIGTKVEGLALEIILGALSNGDVLCAKWMPRENKSKGEFAKFLMESFGLNPKAYRTMLSKLSGNLVERQMCQNEWAKIKFSAVPSMAMKVYRKAFAKHQPERFMKYLEDVKKGTEKINTSVLTPVDIVHQYLQSFSSKDDVLEALWTNLKDTVPEFVGFLPICDLSGSMAGTPMEVSIALGIYLSQRNKSIFKNGFITFSRIPKFVYLTGKTLRDNLEIMRRINMAENTDLEAVFQLILSTAIREKLNPEDMPTHLMIISDMQFDGCTGRSVPSNRVGRYSWERYQEIPLDNTALEMISRMYREAGYERPRIFFWNVRTSEGVPAKVDDKGVALISGYSTNLLSSILTGDLNPLNQVRAILDSPRYAFVNEFVE